jgi:hypothetical protein
VFSRSALPIWTVLRTYEKCTPTGELLEGSGELQTGELLEGSNELLEGSARAPGNLLAPTSS